MPGVNFINTYDETQKTLEDMVSKGSSGRPDVVSSSPSKVKEPENPKEVESVAKKVVDKIETIEENDERITNEKFSEHIGRRGMVLRSVLMSSPRRSSKTLNPGDRCIFKTRKSMTEHLVEENSHLSKQKIDHTTNVFGPVTRSRARTMLCYKALYLKG